MLLTQLVLKCQINFNTNTIVVILSHKKNRKITYGDLIGNYGKLSFVLRMHVFLNSL